MLIALRSAAGRQDPIISVVKSAFDRRAERIDAALARLKSLHASGLLIRHSDQVLGNMAHMHLNRVCRSRDRFEELATYDSLGLLYEGFAARAAGRGAAAAASVAVG